MPSVKVRKTETGSKVEMEREVKTKDSDYYISSINIEPVDNGLIVSCSYRMHSKVRDKYRSSGCYPDSYREGPKKVFQNFEEAEKFISSEFSKMKKEKAD